MTTPGPVPAAEDELLVGPEVANWLRCSLRTVERLVADGQLVVVQDRTRRRRYLRSDVAHYLERHRRASSAESA